MGKHDTHKRTSRGKIETLRRREIRIDKYGKDLRQTTNNGERKA